MFLKQKIKLFFFKGMYVLAPVVVALGGGTASTLWMIPHSTFSPGKRLDLGQLPDYGQWELGSAFFGSIPYSCLLVYKLEAGVETCDHLQVKMCNLPHCHLLPEVKY